MVTIEALRPRPAPAKLLANMVYVGVVAELLDA
jgi:hypothetical protein